MDRTWGRSFHLVRVVRLRGSTAASPSAFYHEQRRGRGRGTGSCVAVERRARPSDEGISIKQLGERRLLPLTLGAWSLTFLEADGSELGRVKKKFPDLASLRLTAMPGIRPGDVVPVIGWSSVGYI